MKDMKRPLEEEKLKPNKTQQESVGSLFPLCRQLKLYRTKLQNLKKIGTAMRPKGASDALL